MNFEDLTNKDLKEYCESEGIDVDSKNVSKPTKKEYIEAIGKHEAQLNLDTEDFLDNEIKGKSNGVQEKINETENKTEAKSTKKVKSKTLTRSQKRRNQYNTLMAKKRVIVTSNQDNQTKVKNSVQFVTWGNRLLGHQTDRVIFDKPWYIREGALENLRNAIVTESVQDEEGNKIDTVTKPAYIIQELGHLNKTEIDTIAKRQLIRDSSIDSLT